MARYIILTGNTRITELEFLASQICGYTFPEGLALYLLDAVNINKESTKAIARYSDAKNIIAWLWHIDIFEVSELCILARQVKFWFDEHDGFDVTPSLERYISWASNRH